MNKKGIIMILLAIITVFIIVMCINFIVPKKITTSHEDITKITIFNGNTGNQAIITNQQEIQNIVNNLNDIGFLKTGISIGYIGYSLDITYYGKGDKEIKNFIINGESTVRYRGFFYKPQNTSLVYDYLANLTSN